MIYEKFLSTDDMATLECFHMGSCLPLGVCGVAEALPVLLGPPGIVFHQLFDSLLFFSLFHYTLSLTLIIVVKWSGVLLLVVLMRPWLFQASFLSFIF